MIAKWVIVGLMVLGTLLQVASVGKERKPITSGSAAFSVLVSGLVIAAIVIWWRS